MRATKSPVPGVIKKDRCRSERRCLLFFNCFYRAGIGASATTDANIGINYVPVFAFFDGANRAGVCTGAAFDTGFANFIGHYFAPPLCC